MLLVANHKMNLTKEEILSYKEAMQNKMHDNVVICPQDIYLETMQSKSYKLGAQNVSEKEEGSLTGENSAKALKSVGAEYVIVGHSERRKLFDEGNELVNKKIKVSQTNKLTPILCIGETKEERNQGKTNEVLKKQLNECLNDITEEVIIAYEPIWAIGTGLIPTNKEIEDVISFLKNIKQYKVLYGGSVNTDNIDTLLKINNLDGFFIGGASLKTNSFLEIISKASSN